LAMAVNSSCTFSAVFADVSKKSSPASFAYASASAVSIARLSGCSVTKSSLFPASAMMMFSLACRWSSLTHDLALSRDVWELAGVSRGEIDGTSEAAKGGQRGRTHGLRNVVDDDGAVGVPVVHGRQRLVPLLARCVPDLKLDCRVLVERDGLCEEGGADGGFPVRVELVLDEPQHDRALSHGGFTEQHQLELGEAVAHAAAAGGSSSRHGRGCDVWWGYAVLTGCCRGLRELGAGVEREVVSGCREQSVANLYESRVKPR
jgi:hypothetical protein